jgi:hypothetical protein
MVSRPLGHPELVSGSIFNYFYNVKRSFSIFICLAAALFGLSAAAQTSSREIPGLRPYDVDLKIMSVDEKDSVRMVSELWNEYVASFTDEKVSDERRREMWVDGAEDYLMEFDDGNLLYGTFRENKIEDIRKINGGTYEITIVSLSRLPGENEGWVECAYRVLAMAVAKAGKGENPFRLCNYLDAIVPTLEKTEGQGIVFYAPQYINIPKKTLASVAEFIESFKSEYGISASDEVECVIEPDADACVRSSGVIFNVYHNPMMAQEPLKYTNGRFYGKIFPSGKILTNFFDDNHDIVLSILNREYPDALPMMREGAAIFHGGWMDFDYASLRSCLINFLNLNEGIVLTNMDDLLDVMVPVSRNGSSSPEILIPLQYLIGARLADIAFSKYGAWKVKELLECKTYSDLPLKLGSAPENILSLLNP